MLDPALAPYVDAPHPREAERLLGVLLEQRIAPLIRRIAADKLRAHGGAAPFDAADLEDVESEAMLLLVARVQSLKADPGVEPIQNLETYAATVTFHACAHALRRRHPARSRLKNRLRYVLTQDVRFRLWTAEGLGSMCGYAKWHASNTAPAPAARLAALEADLAEWAPDRLDLERDDPAPAIDALLRAAGGPLELDRLVTIVAAAGSLRRPADLRSAMPVESIAARAEDRERSLDQRRFAERLWGEIEELPPRQRVALLLNLRDADGSGALWLFPVTGVASMRVIARALGMEDLDLAELWGRLPLDDRTIAERLDCTRQQVINLRMSARKRLTNRLSGLDAGGANPGRESPSSEGGT